MNYNNVNLNEEKKKQNTQSEYGANIQSDYGPKPFTNNQNASIFKMTGSPNKNLKATANMYNNQIVKNNYDNPTVKKDADYLNNPQTVKPKPVTNSNYNQIIPKEKKEQERLQRITGTYDLRKADQSEIRKHIKLKEKRPDDYYRYDSTMDSKESKRRLDEVFGPKTDFSIWNFENNYGKMNKEEQEMLVHKMQLDFNNLNYKDATGQRLKTDGKYGNKTKAVYEQYKKDNKEDYDDYNEFKKQEDKGYSILTDDNGKPIYFASVNNDLSGLISNKEDKKINTQTSKTLVKSKDRDKEILTNEDYEKIQIYKAIYNYAKNEMKDDAIADSVHREAVKIRQQDKYAMHEDYGPERIKKFNPAKGTQYVGVEGYTDGDYNYSDTKDTATIHISEPLSSDDADYQSGLYPGIISNANAMTDRYPELNMLSGVIDLIMSKTYPLYSRVHEGDVIVTVKKHKGGYTPSTQKEYKFYFGKDKNKFYYVK